MSHHGTGTPQCMQNRDSRLMISAVVAEDLARLPEARLVSRHGGALLILRNVAHLSVNLGAGCPPIGAPAAAVSLSASTMRGGIDCDGDVDAVDALRILRHVAGLSNNLPPGCPPIGERI